MSQVTKNKVLERRGEGKKNNGVERRGEGEKINVLHRRTMCWRGGEKKKGEKINVHCSSPLPGRGEEQ